VKHPEYLKEGQKLVFREGRTKAVSIPIFLSIFVVLYF
jgi:GTPase